MDISFIDLKAQYQSIQSNVSSAINQVLEHGQYILGPEVEKLEQTLQRYVGVKAAIGCSSGTDALLLALMALNIGKNDEVIIPDFSFFATAEVVSFLGATPIFADIDPKTYTIDPRSIEKLITKKTKAIIPVSLFGQCADFDLINRIASQNNIPVIEDGAQSFGATYKGKKSCSLTTIACTSFFPSKPLGCYGDGGAIFTNDESIALKIRQLLAHGQSSRYTHTSIGINGRLDTMQAAILLEKLKIFDNEVILRQEVAKRYNQSLAKHFIIPEISLNNSSVYAQYTIQVNDRELFRSKLLEKGIPTAVHYPKVISEQPVYSELYDADTPVSKNLSSKVVSLPFHPYLNPEEQNYIIGEVLNTL